MSRTRRSIAYTVGAAAGLFLTAVASSAVAAADTTLPALPGVPGMPGVVNQVVDQVVASSAGIPQQLLQTTTSALTGGTPLAPAMTPAAGQAPLASATLNLPQAPAALTPGAAPAAGLPTGIPTGLPTGLPGMQGFQMPTSLSQFLPFPLPNLAGSGTGLTSPAASSAMLPNVGAFLPTVPTVPTVPAGVPVQAPAMGWMPVSGLP